MMTILCCADSHPTIRMQFNTTFSLSIRHFDEAGLLRSLVAIHSKAADQARLVAANTKLANIPHRSGSLRAALTIYISGHPAINRK